MNVYAINNLLDINNLVDIRAQVWVNGLLFEREETVRIPDRTAYAQYHLIRATHDGIGREDKPWVAANPRFIAVPLGTPCGPNEMTISAWGTLLAWPSTVDRALFRAEQSGLEVTFHGDYQFNDYSVNAGNPPAPQSTQGIMRAKGVQGAIPVGYAAGIYVRGEVQRLSSGDGLAQANLYAGPQVTDGGTGNQDGNLAFRSQFKGRCQSGQLEVSHDRTYLPIPPGQNEGLVFHNCASDFGHIILASGFRLKPPISGR